MAECLYLVLIGSGHNCGQSINAWLQVLHAADCGFQKRSADPHAAPLPAAARRRSTCMLTPVAPTRLPLCLSPYSYSAGEAKTADLSAAETMFEHLCLTLVHESHLCPVPFTSQPVYWQYDHALRLYPVPDALIIGDSTPAASCITDGCACINPVSCS